MKCHGAYESFMAEGQNDIFVFEDFLLDTGAAELHRDGTLIPVEPQVFDLLVLLLCNHDRVVSRDEIDFTQYTERNFPFTVRQPPGDLNALGLVKFMFPNPHAIYLHDTPAKNLFQREVRAYSSGCIRLNDPFDFAYTLLARQMSNPKQFFDAELATGRQSRVDLKEPVPVHLVYRTAFTTARGGVEFRRDFYGRDAKIWAGLRNAGVALRAVQG